MADSALGSLAQAGANAADEHIADPTAAHAATAISFTPNGSIAATDVQAAIQEVRDEAGGGGAPTTADYLVGTADAGLSNEIVVGTSPGGELGGTWASPTVDAVHSGSSHASVQAAAEATAAAALNAHLTDATDAHDASAISIADAGNDFTATDVEGALDELQADHEADATALADHIADATAAHAASAISFTPDGSIAATTVQAAIQEVRDEAGGGGAPTTVDYLVGTASGGLSAEIVVGTSPGGELGGTWASPTVDATHSGSSHAAVQAAAEATAQAALDAHLNDTSDAHDASAISILDSAADFTATDVEGALAELQSDHEADATALSDHIADATAAHAASAISVSSTTLSGTGTDVQAVFEEIDNLLDDHSARHENGGADEISIAGLDGTPVELTNHLNDTTAAHAASAISYAGGTGMSATDVEAAIDELATEKLDTATYTAREREVQIWVTAPTDSLTTGDGKAYYFVSDSIGGLNLIDADAAVVTVSSSGLPTIQIRNVTQAADMLTTRITIDANERTSYTAAAAPVIDAANDDVATGDLLAIDVDVAGTGTQGLCVILTFGP